MGNISHEEIDRKNGVLNFGSFIFGPIFLLFNGKLKEGLIWLFGLPIFYFILNIFIGGSTVNILIIVTNLFIWIYYSVSGNEILWNHKKCKTVQDFIKVNRIWNILSLSMIFVYLIIIYILYNL